jgi:hypothetical protein
LRFILRQMGQNAWHMHDLRPRPGRHGQQQRIAGRLGHRRMQRQRRAKGLGANQADLADVILGQQHLAVPARLEPRADAAAHQAQMVMIAVKDRRARLVLQRFGQMVERGGGQLRMEREGQDEIPRRRPRAHHHGLGMVVARLGARTSRGTPMVSGGWAS